MKVVVKEEDILIQDFIKVLEKGERWVKVPWTVPQFCDSGAILLFGKDDKGVYCKKGSRKVYVDVKKIPSVKLVEVKDES